MLERLLRALVGAIACVATVAAAGTGGVASERPEVEAAGERLVGVWLDEEAGLAVFRGIPYAAPPLGPLRWRPPQSPTPKPGPRDASRFGPACPQLQGNPGWYRQVAASFGHPPEVVPDLAYIREDCLYLNVWSENLEGDDLQPVMVWIHGGSNRNGYANEPNYRGHNLARRGVVVVSINYRLGPLGFMAHPALTAESERNVSGNYGILDQIAALRWVRANIAAFGGDPQQVAVFGESAGAADTGTLITTPLAKGLFRRAIMQSGGYQINRVQTLRDEEVLGVELMGALGIGGDAPLAEMRALPWNEVLNAVGEVLPDHYYDVVVDGWVLDQTAIEVLRAGVQSPVDLVIGTTVNEWSMYIPDDAGEEQLREALDTWVLEEDREAMLSILGPIGTGNVQRKLDRLGGAAFFLCPSKVFARAMRRVADRVYFYRFSRVRPGGERYLAYHAAEIPYVFDTADAWLPGDSTDRMLTDAMTTYWTQFAKTGDPNAPGLPAWPAFDPAAEDHQHLGDEVRSAKGLETELCRIIDRARSR